MFTQSSTPDVHFVSPARNTPGMGGWETPLFVRFCLRTPTVFIFGWKWGDVGRIPEVGACMVLASSPLESMRSGELGWAGPPPTLGNPNVAGFLGVRSTRNGAGGKVLKAAHVQVAWMRWYFGGSCFLCSIAPGRTAEQRSLRRCLFMP